MDGIKIRFITEKQKKMRKNYGNQWFAFQREVRHEKWWAFTNSKMNRTLKCTAFRERILFSSFFFIYMYIKYSIQLQCFARFSLMGARERMVNRRIMGASSIWKCMWIWSHRFRIDIYSFLHTVLFSSLLSFWLKLSRYWDFNRIPRLFFSPECQRLWLLIYAMESDRRFIHIIALHILPSNEIHPRSATKKKTTATIKHIVKIKKRKMWNDQYEEEKIMTPWYIVHTSILLRLLGIIKKENKKKMKSKRERVLR